MELLSSQNRSASSSREDVNRNVNFSEFGIYLCMGYLRDDSGLLHNQYIQENMQSKAERSKGRRRINDGYQSRPASTQPNYSILYYVYQVLGTEINIGWYNNAA